MAPLPSSLMSSSTQSGRALQLPALALEIGPKTWWPSKLARERRGPKHAAGREPEPIQA